MGANEEPSSKDVLELSFLRLDIRSRVGHYGSRRITGREDLRQFISGHTRAPELWHKHMIVEPVMMNVGVMAPRDGFGAAFIVLGM